MKSARIEVHRQTPTLWGFRIVARNGRKVFTPTETFAGTPSKVVRAIRRAIKVASQAAQAPALVDMGATKREWPAPRRART
jgi:hypothetical protein